MNHLSIQAQGLSKRYQIGARQRTYRTIRESLVETARAPFRRLLKRSGNAAEATRVWALRDVAFEIGRGEVVGVIGRNGAGKSTLLKVLSRITEPTSGWADIHGRIGSLLEVGTGFHGELTGRENIFLNGAILGMPRKQIQRQFDEIVAFAGVDRYIDTAVKFYSSGMYLRLAFAVAAHLEPEILLVDEVLAVGDAAFQNKCLGRLNDVARQGRTVIFVSHNMGAIRSLCSRGIVLHEGTVIYTGNIGQSIETYYRLALQDTQAEKDVSRTGFGRVYLADHDSSTIDQNEPFEVATTMHIATDVAGFTLLCVLEDMNQRTVCHLREESTNLTPSGPRGKHDVRLGIPALGLEPGMYTIYFKMILWGSSGSSKHVSDVLHLDVGGTSSGWNSVLSPKVDWQVRPAELESPMEVAG
jgi:lipopolysaccharide transport system ATP-binding protein